MSTPQKTESVQRTVGYEAVDDDGQTLRDVLLSRLRWEYGEEAPWTELRSLDRLERDVRRWFKDQGVDVAVLRLSPGSGGVDPAEPTFGDLAERRRAEQAYYDGMGE